MHIKSLIIQTPESWQENAGKLVGVVLVDCGLSQMTIRLSDATIKNIFEVVREEASLQVRKDAAAVGNIFKSAIAGDLMLEDSSE